MSELASWLFTRFMPHGHCFFWTPDVLWVHVVSDALIALSYYSIPLTLLYFTRHRRDLPYRWVFYCFGAFIVACGTTHVVDIVTLWIPIYRVDGFVKAVTAGISLTTAVLLVPLVPKALSLRSPAQLEEANARLDALNKSLAATTEELRRSNVELEQFAYVASHDLQEPLRGISGCVQLLQRRYAGKLDDHADEFIQLAVDGAERMRSLITDLLTFSRLATRGESIEPIAAEVPVRGALANLGAAIREKKAVVTVGELPVILGDRSQLVQLFQNLVGNAIKFSGERRPEISISAHRDGEACRFEVRDNGIGIDPQYWERIFRIFQRLHTRVDYPGTGVGLAICQKIVERHGGRIWVDSRPGEGSTFLFTLPPAAAAGPS